MSDHALVLSSLVGSHLWGTATEASDHDVREVVMSPLSTLISPFRKGELIHPQQREVPYPLLGDRVCDVALYELNRFVGLAVKGNPTLLETLFGHHLWFSAGIGSTLVQNRQKLLNSENIMKHHLGFVREQLRGAELPKPPRPIGKLLVSSYIGTRVCTQLLTNKSIDPSSVISPMVKDTVIAAKSGDSTAFPYMRRLVEVGVLAVQAQSDTIHPFTHDETFIKEFLLNAYGSYR